MKNFYVIYSGVHHVIEALRVFEENKKLESFFTSFVIKNDFYNILSKINSDKFLKILELRDFREINSKNIYNYPHYELIELLTKQLLGKNYFTTTKMPHWRDQSFSKRVSKNIDKDCLGVYGYPNNLLESFKVVNENSIKIIEQPIGHIGSAIELFSEEKYLNPEFADSITFNSNDKKYLDRISEEQALSNLICVPSVFVKNTMIENGVQEGKIRINQFGSSFLPVKSIKSNLNKEITLLFVGQLTQRKGIKYLLEAIKILKKDKLRFKFILVGPIIGKGDWFKDYTSFIDEYYPSIPKSKLNEVYKRADIFVLPSLFEGSALVVYEALAHGVPCIVTPNTGADFIKNGINGYQIPIRNISKIIEIVSLLDDNRELLKSLKINALKTSHELTWMNYRKRFKEILFHANY